MRRPLLTLACALLIAACARAPGWSYTPAAEATQDPVPHDDVRIYRSALPEGEYLVVGTARSSAGEVPDLPAVYLELRERASRLGANVVLLRFDSMLSVKEAMAAGNSGVLAPVKYATIEAVFVRELDYGADSP